MARLYTFQEVLQSGVQTEQLVIRPPLPELSNAPILNGELSQLWKSIQNIFPVSTPSLLGSSEESPFMVDLRQLGPTEPLEHNGLKKISSVLRRELRHVFERVRPN